MKKNRMSDASVFYGWYNTPWGRGIIAEQNGRIVRILLPSDTQQKLHETLERDFPGAEISEGLQKTAPTITQLEQYFLGKPVQFNALLDYDTLTDYQKRVMNAAVSIPWGQLRTYGWLAGQANSPHSARACGQVMAANPYPVIVPCHRIIAAGGGLGGFSSGLHWKERLLKLEGSLP